MDRVRIDGSKLVGVELSEELVVQELDQEIEHIGGAGEVPDRLKWWRDILRLRNLFDPPVPPQAAALFTH